jgi:hypothetical protein
MVTLSRAIDSVEGFEHLGQMLDRDTVAGVGDGQVDANVPAGVRADTVTVPPDGVRRNALPSRFPRT